MKKALKILLYVLGSLVLLNALLFIFHDPLIRFALRRAVKYQSNGTVLLTMDRFNLELLKGHITINKPQLSFDTTTFDTSQNIILQKLRFDQIEIEQLDIRKLVVERHIIARHFTVDRPQLWFLERGKRVQSSFHPEKLITSLIDYPEMMVNSVVRIDSIEINYGSIRVNEMARMEVDPGEVDFTLILKDFNTAADSTDQTIRYLFSREFLFKIKNLRRELPSGYLIELDSATFSTLKKDIIAEGIRLQPLAKAFEQNALGLTAGKLVLNDMQLEEIRGIEDLSLSSIFLQDGYFTYHQNTQNQNGAKAADSNSIELLTRFLENLALDTVSVEQFGFSFVNDQVDTLVDCMYLDFLATDISLDSGFVSDPKRHINYAKVELNTGPVYSGIVEGARISLGTSSYSTTNNSLSVTELSVQGDSMISPLPLNINVSELKLDNVPLKQWQAGSTLNPEMVVVNPVIDLDLDHPLLKPSGNQGSSTGLNDVLPEKLVVEQADLTVTKGNEFSMAIDGLDLNVDGISVYLTDSFHLDYKELFVQWKGSEFNVDGQRYNMQTGMLTYDDQLMVVSGFNAYFPADGESNTNSFRFKKFKAAGLDLRQIVRDEMILLGDLVLDKPVLDGKFKLQETGGDSAFRFPVDVGIQSLVVNQGGIRSTIDRKGEPIEMSFDYDISLGPLSLAKQDTPGVLLKQLNWDLFLQNLEITGYHHQLSVPFIHSNSYTSEFQLDSLEVKFIEGDTLENFNIKELHVSEVDITNLDYQLLLMEDSVSLGKLALFEPSLHLQTLKKDSLSRASTQRDFDLKQYQYFNYDTLGIHNFDLRIESLAGAEINDFALKDLTIVHQKDATPGIRLGDEVKLDFQELTYADTASGETIRVSDGHLTPDGSSFRVDNISVMNYENQEAQSKTPELSGYELDFSGVRFSGLYLKDALPSRLAVKKLGIDDFHLVVNQQVDKKKKSDLKLNLQIIKRFSKTMTRFSIDTIDIENSSLTYRALSDTSSGLYVFDSLGVTIHRVNIDTSMVGQSEPELIKDLTVDLQDKSVITADSLYTIMAGFIRYDFPNKSITIDSLSVLPRYEDSLFFEKAVYQTDRATIKGQRVELQGFGVEELLQRDHLYFSNINLVGFDVDLVRDKRYPFEPGLVRQMPREQIMSVEQKFTVDSIHLIDAIIHYKEIEEKIGLPGLIFFDSVQGSIYNMTNNLEPGDRSTRMLLKARGNIMGQTQMNVSVYFPLYPDTVTFWLSGESERMEMMELNPLTENILGIGILQGRGELDIPLIIGGDSLAKGNLTFRYKKLKLAMYNRKKEQLNQGTLSPLISFLINSLVVKSNNPRFARKPRVGQVYFRRDTRKASVNYLWKSILSGMLSTLGFNSKEQRQELKELKKNQ